MIIRYIAIIIGTIFEIYATNLFVSAFLKRKTHKNCYLMIFYLAVLVFQIIASINYKGIVLLACSFITAFTICCIYISKIYLKLVLSIAIIVINIASEMAVSGVLMLSKTIDFNTIDSDPYLFALGTFLSKFLMFLVVSIAYIRKFKLNVDNLKLRHLLILSVLPLTTIFILIMMYYVLHNITEVKLKLMFVVTSAFVMISNVVTFSIINKQNSLAKAEYELKLLKESINEQEKHYKALQSSHEEIRQMRHNIKSICLATIAEIKAGNFNAAIEELNSNINTIDETNRVIDTGHPAIDTIIENKSKYCSELNIDIRLSYCYKEMINISEIEIAVIIGNILDNAIEACKNYYSERKEIWGTITVDEFDIIINIKNSANEFNNFKTLKHDSKNHGYGLKSISHIANKYNGYANFTFEDNVFSSYVVLKN